MIQTYAPTLFGNAAAECGRHPFPHPTGNLSEPYVNPLGAQLVLYVLRVLRKFGCGITPRRVRRRPCCPI